MLRSPPPRTRDLGDLPALSWSSQVPPPIDATRPPGPARPAPARRSPSTISGRPRCDRRVRTALPRPRLQPMLAFIFRHAELLEMVEREIPVVLPRRFVRWLRRRRHSWDAVNATGTTPTPTCVSCRVYLASVDASWRWLGAVLGEAAGVGEHEGHEVFGGADAEHAVAAPALAVLIDVVAPALLAPQQRRHRVPRVGRHL